MWNRSAKNKMTGKIVVVCTDWNNKEVFRGEFDTLEAANKAGENAERQMTLKMQMPDIEAIGTIEMTDEEILAELMK